MENNVNIERTRPCTGCFSCEFICPRKAIKVRQDVNGFYKPFIDDNKCIDCGLCKSVCYSHTDDFCNSKMILSFYGFLKDENLLFNSASGGASRALMISLYEKGYNVFGCAYDNEKRIAKHILIKKVEDISRTCGSKYFQSDLSECSTLYKTLDKNAKIAFFGLPCQVYGQKKLLAKLGFKTENLFFVEIFCHGIVSVKMWDSYLNSKKHKPVLVRFRTKHFGWHIPCNEFKNSNNKLEFSKRSGDPFFDLYYSQNAFNESCYDCKARSTLGIGDIRIGDFWGTKFEKNKKGVSCIISFNEKATNILNLTVNNFSYFNCDKNEILLYQSYDRKQYFNQKIWNQVYEMLNREEKFSKISKVSTKDISFYKRLKKKLVNFLSNLKHKNDFF